MEHSNVSLYDAKILQAAANCKRNEAIVGVGQPLTVKMLTGDRVWLEAPKLTPEDTIRLMTSITPNPNLEEFDSDGSTEFEASIHDDHRFRISIVTEGDGVRIHGFRIQEAR